MHLTHLNNLIPASPSIAKVSTICWSPNGMRLAVSTADRVVHLFDENGERKDKFSTKPADKQAPKAYMVTGMCFSPDSAKLAIAQSDQIVFVYKLGTDWGDKKSICNKFAQSSPVTCVTWPTAQPGQVVFGLQDGKVKVGQLRTNKSATIYTGNSYVVSCCSSPEGDAILCGHADGSLHCFRFESDASAPMHALFATHSCVPTCLGWGASIVAAGSDKKVSFYDMQGALERTFDYTEGNSIKEFSSLAFSPNGESLALGNFSTLYSYTFNPRNQEWSEANPQTIPNFYTVSAMGWRPDGSQVVLGSLCGAADVFDVCVRRVRYKGRYEFTYVSPSQVIVTRLSSGLRIILRSTYGVEILRINVFRDRYLVAHTAETLLLGDLESCKLSEIPWQGGYLLQNSAVPAEKFYFDNSAVCLVHSAGQLTLVEYGENDILGTCRTEHVSPHLLSIRINERPSSSNMADRNEAGNKKIGYLLDRQTVRVVDLMTGIATATVHNDTKIDWLELNSKANLLLFRDKHRRLVLFNIDTQERTTLLQYCDYVQWVPQSDVVVAQSRAKLCVWYSIRNPDNRTTYDISGDVEEIERAEGHTEVIVDEGMNTASYVLDEGLIGFGTAMEDHDYESAMTILEGLNETPEARAMWQQLLDAVITSGDLFVAQRCCAALGDLPRASFLAKTAKIASMAEEKLGGDGKEFWMVRARMAQLRGNLQEAESIFIEQGKIQEAISMYETLQLFDEAIAVAESHGHPHAADMRRQFFGYLLQTGQEDKAAQLKEQDGDIVAAIDLYIKGGFPAKAYSLVIPRPDNFQNNILEHIAACLGQVNMHGKAGHLYEKMGNQQRALDAFVRGHNFREAVELARRYFPGHVVELEKAWGEYLVQQKRTDAAINHFIEAGAHDSAINAALQGRMFHKAAQLLNDSMSENQNARSYWIQIAKHYDESGMVSQAEQAYLKAGDTGAAVDVHMRHQEWEAAYRVALASMSNDEVTRLFIDQAQHQSIAGHRQAAEKLYLLINQPDLAINMYKKCRDYDSMVRLVAAYRQPHLKQTHMHLARQLESDGEFKKAERHFCEAGDWEAAVTMYRTSNMWDEAIRVGKRYGGRDAAHQIAYAQALAIGGGEGAKLLNRRGLIEQAVDYACEVGNWDHAMELARKHKLDKIPDVHLKHALFLEDEGQFSAAEEEFVKASKPREAVDMYLHQKDWPSAMRVAESYDPSSMPDVLVAQANFAAQTGDLSRAEELFLDAKKPELAVEMYLSSRQFADGMRVTKRYLPHKVQDVNNRVQRLVNAPNQASGENSEKSIGELVSQARMWEDNGDWNLAIDSYLRCTGTLTHDVEQLLTLWRKAASLAAKHERRRYPEVCDEIGRRLAQLQPPRWDEAGDMMAEAESWKEAIDCYIRASSWEKAKRIVNSGAPQYRDFVQNAYSQHLQHTGDADGARDAGQIDVALQMYARQGEHEKLFATASKAGSQILAQYIFPYVSDALKQGKTGEVVRVFAQYGAPAMSSQLPLYKRLVESIFGSTDAGNSTAVGDESILRARDIFYKVISGLRRQADAGTADTRAMREFERLLLLLHYAAMRVMSQRLHLDELSLKICISMLRFCGYIPADRAFYEAGIAARKIDQLSVAFVMLNRYLDISEAIEDEDTSNVDNADFADADIPSPAEFPLPSVQWLNDAQRDEVKDWVLTISMDRKTQQELPAGAVPLKSQSNQPKCIISGFPVASGDAVNCPSCGSAATKKWWNAVIQKTRSCPWCSAQSNPIY